MAEDKDGKIVCQYAGIATLMNHDGETIKALQPVDSMLHPDLRKTLKKKSIHQDTYEKFLQESIYNDVKFIYGFPNREAMRIGRRFLGYRRVGIISNWVFHVSWINAIRHRFHSIEKLLKKAPFRIEQVNEFDKRTDYLWQHLKPYHKVAIIRDSNYFNWRYAHHPQRKYQLFQLVDKNSNGVLAVTVLGQDTLNNGLILELFTNPHEQGIVSFLLNFAICHFIKNKKKSIHIWMASTFKRIVNMLKLIGFKEYISFPSDSFTFIEQPHLYSDMQFLTENWYCSMGDMDI